MSLTRRASSGKERARRLCSWLTTRVPCRACDSSRLESQARQGTRVVNQLHNLLARSFPELALRVSDISAGWVLALLDQYPTAAKLARARTSALEKIPYLPHEHIEPLLASART